LVRCETKKSLTLGDIAGGRPRTIEHVHTPERDDDETGKIVRD